MKGSTSSPKDLPPHVFVDDLQQNRQKSFFFLEIPGADERLGDAIMLAVLLFAFCAYWLSSRKPRGLWARQAERGQGDNTSGANEVYVGAAAHVAQDYWDRYDKAQGWTSSIAPSSKTKSGFEGGKSVQGANRPLDVGCPTPSSRVGACVFKCTYLHTH